MPGSVRPLSPDAAPRVPPVDELPSTSPGPQTQHSEDPPPAQRSIHGPGAHPVQPSTSSSVTGAAIAAAIAADAAGALDATVHDATVAPDSRRSQEPPDGDAEGHPHDEDDDDDDDRGSRASAPSGWLAYLLFALLLLPLLQFAVGSLSVWTLAVGYPEEDPERTDAYVMRATHWAFLVSPPRGIVAMAPFAFTYAFSTRDFVTRSAVVGIVGGSFQWLLQYESHSSSENLAFTVLAAPFQALFYLLPLLLVQGREKRGQASTDKPAMRGAMRFALGGLVATTILTFWLGPAIILLYTVVILVIGVLAIRRDPAERTQLNDWYLVAIFFLASLLPAGTSSVALVLVTNLDQADLIGSLIMAMSIAFFLFLVMLLQRALARRALPARFRTVVLFPIQVFEDVYIEFLFVNAGLFSGGFFALLVLQIARTLGRDTGFFLELRRLVRNVYLERQGLPTLPREDDAVVEWTRIWLQNMLSELSSIFVFVGAVVGELWRGERIGSLTDLDESDRYSLLGGYAIVFSVGALTHVACYLILRRSIITEQARIFAKASVGSGAHGERSGRLTLVALGKNRFTLANEASKLISRHGLFLVGTLLYVSTTAVFQVRLLRLGF